MIYEYRDWERLWFVPWIILDDTRLTYITVPLAWPLWERSVASPLWCSILASKLSPPWLLVQPAPPLPYSIPHLTGYFQETLVDGTCWVKIMLYRFMSLINTHEIHSWSWEFSGHFPEALSMELTQLLVVVVWQPADKSHFHLPQSGGRNKGEHLSSAQAIWCLLGWRWRLLAILLVPHVAL